MERMCRSTGNEERMYYPSYALTNIFITGSFKIKGELMWLKRWFPSPLQTFTYILYFIWALQWKLGEFGPSLLNQSQLKSAEGFTCHFNPDEGNSFNLILISKRDTCGWPRLGREGAYSVQAWFSHIVVLLPKNSYSFFLSCILWACF